METFDEVRALIVELEKRLKALPKPKPRGQK